MVGDFNSLCPQDSSDVILKSIKNSNLHFNLNETPFSVYITIRKKYLKFPQSFVNGNQVDLKPEYSEIGSKAVDLVLVEENAILKAKIEEQDTAKRGDEEIVRDLADKLALAKSEISDYMSKNRSLEKVGMDRLEQIEAAKTVTKKLNDELCRSKNEVGKIKKELKANEKEIYNLKNKVDNLEDKANKIKSEKYELSREISKLKNEIKQQERKAKKIVETNNNKSTKAEFKCDECDESFISTAEMKNHKQVSHASVSNSECDKIIESEATDDHIPEEANRISISSSANLATTSAPSSTLFESDATVSSTVPTSKCSFASITPPRLPSSTDTSNSSADSEAQNEMECDICTELFTHDDDLKKHIKAEHKNFNYNCKLCDKSFTTYEDHINHRHDEGHLNLSKGVRDEFMVKVGNECSECQISETQGNTHYYFCENDDHMDIFEHIWNLRQRGSMQL